MKRVVFVSLIYGIVFCNYSISSSIDEFPLDRKSDLKIWGDTEITSQKLLAKVPFEKQVEPFLPEGKMFSFKTSTSNSVTPLSLSLLNREFFAQTKGENSRVRDERNTGTVMLNLLVREVYLNTDNAKKILETKNKDELSREILMQYLDENKGIFNGYKEYYEKNGSLTLEQVANVSDRIKIDLLQGPESNVKVMEKPEIQNENYVDENLGKKIPLTPKKPKPEKSLLTSVWDSILGSN